MATLALAAVASSLTAGLGGLGGALISAVAVAGAQYVGGMIDAAIFGGGNSSTQKRVGPRLDNLDGIEYDGVRCDVLDRRAVRRALRDVDRVFHSVGHTSLRASPEALERANVQAARVVLEECLRADVERLATGRAVGDTRLIELQHALIDLVDFLDPDDVRLPGEERHKLPTPRRAVAGRPPAAVTR